MLQEVEIPAGSREAQAPSGEFVPGHTAQQARQWGVLAATEQGGGWEGTRRGWRFGKRWE